MKLRKVYLIARIINNPMPHFLTGYDENERPVYGTDPDKARAFPTEAAAKAVAESRLMNKPYEIWEHQQEAE